MNARILIVDDVLDQVRTLARCLEQEGYEVVLAEDELNAMYLLDVFRPDLIILDIGFGCNERKGLDILKVIRKNDQMIPIIMLTGLDDDRLDPLSYDLDADQFACKSLSTKALLARVRRCLRRDRPELETIDDYIEIDRGNESVKINADGEWQSVHLQPKQFEVLEELVSNAGRVVPRERLYECFFSDAEKPANALNRCISELRRKLEPNPKKPQHILTRRGVGYSFNGFR
jgi:DNA-binding response OmpR family regulator